MQFLQISLSNITVDLCSGFSSGVGVLIWSFWGIFDHLSILHRSGMVTFTSLYIWFINWSAFCCATTPPKRSAPSKGGSRGSTVKRGGVERVNRHSPPSIPATQIPPLIPFILCPSSSHPFSCRLSSLCSRPSSTPIAPSLHHTTLWLSFPSYVSPPAGLVSRLPRLHGSHSCSGLC